MCTPDAQAGQKRALNPLDLELQIFQNSYVGSGTQNQIL